MRDIPTALQASLDTGCTTLARCWRIDRTDGVTLGFTDHDRDLAFDGVTFLAEAGLQASEIEASLGLSVDNFEAAGALRSDAITEADILKGAYDGATVRHYLVDWSDANNRLMLFAGEIGEIRRGELAFEVEFIGKADRLNHPQGRAYFRDCSADVGDARCGVDLTDPAYTGTGDIIATLSDRRVRVRLTSGFEAGWFDGGMLTWTSGANQGQTAPVRATLSLGQDLIVELWTAPATEPAEDDAFTITAGCDKAMGTCSAKFANIANFRGFTHMPGPDWTTSYPREDETHDGGSLYA